MATDQIERFGQNDILGGRQKTTKKKKIFKEISQISVKLLSKYLH